MGIEAGSGQTVAVFGAYGHTGRFVVAQLLERGFVPVLSGRDAGRLGSWRRRTVLGSTSGRRRSTTRPRSTGPWPVRRR